MMLGPQVSRPFTQSLHASAALGFTTGIEIMLYFYILNVSLFLVASLITFFLPNNSEASKELCAQLRNEVNETDSQNNVEIEIGQWSILIFPYFIVGLWTLITGTGLIFLALKGLKLPSYSTGLPEISDEKTDENVQKFSKWRCNCLLAQICLFIFLVGSLDNTFQSRIYTFGLCGPLDLNPSSAGALNTIYFANYLIGRLISIPLSTKVSPRSIILSCNLGCILAASMLIVFGNYSSWALFGATGLMGFSVCFFFGSAITWLTSYLPPTMRSKPMSFIFLGSTLASSAAPLLASKMFDLGPIYVFYLCLLFALLILLCFISMIFVAKGVKK